MKQTNLDYSRSLTDEGKGALFVKAVSKFPLATTAGFLVNFARWLQEEHVEPIILTPEERKAVQLSVAIGLPWIFKNTTAVWLSDHKGCGKVKAWSIPVLDFVFSAATWIPENALDLRTLLKETDNAEH